MRTAAALAVALLAANAAPGSTGTAAENPPKPSRPTLLPASLQPLKLKGARFVPRERVRVTVEVSRGSATRQVRASANGSFVVAFSGVDACDGLSVRAAGERGSRASLQLSSALCGIPAAALGMQGRVSSRPCSPSLARAEAPTPPRRQTSRAG